MGYKYIDLNLYIHIPWCLKKCPYCDFNSHQKSNITTELELNYIDNLILDLNQSLEYFKSKNIIYNNIKTIFIGGGTPSLFSSNSIDILLNNINNIINISKTCEITLEANPATFISTNKNLNNNNNNNNNNNIIEKTKYINYKKTGINRLSIGVQSFDNFSLKQLGRVHNNTDAISAINLAKELDYNLNIDIMHSLPKQTVDKALLDLQTAIDFEPNHISWYQLTLEPNTKFYKHPPVLPDENILDNIYYNGLKLLQNNNYHQYEISAFALNNQHQSQHNLNYWRYGDYIGIGAGAHSKVHNIRQWKQKSPIRYLDTKINKISGSSILNNKEILLEFMMNKLRILEPITEQEFYYHTKLKFDHINNILNKAIDKNWLSLKRSNNNTKLLIITEFGRRFLNDLILLFA